MPFTTGNTLGSLNKGHPYYPIKSIEALLERNRKIGDANRGKKASKATRLKQSIAAKKRGNNKPITSVLIACTFCGKETPKYQRDLRKSKNLFCSRKCAYETFKGRHHSPNSQFKRGQNAGAHHPQWKGGITPVNNKIRGSFEYKIWQDAVKKRTENVKNVGKLEPAV